MKRITEAWGKLDSVLSDVVEHLHNCSDGNCRPATAEDLLFQLLPCISDMTSAVIDPKSEAAISPAHINY